MECALVEREERELRMLECAAVLIKEWRRRAVDRRRGGSQWPGLRRIEARGGRIKATGGIPTRQGVKTRGNRTGTQEARHHRR